MQFYKKKQFLIYISFSYNGNNFFECFRNGIILVLIRIYNFIQI